MTAAEITKKMIAYSNGNLHDICHFLKVYAYAKTIGECEGLDGEKQLTLEIAALLHDIACPLCREKYGNTNGKYQEIEGEKLGREFLADTGLDEKIRERVVYLIAHHHSPNEVDGEDYQILLEADYLVNADEGGDSRAKIKNTGEHIFKTKTGRELLKEIYKTDEVR